MRIKWHMRIKTQIGEFAEHNLLTHIDRTDPEDIQVLALLEHLRGIVRYIYDDKYRVDVIKREPGPSSLGELVR